MPAINPTLDINPGAVECSSGSHVSISIAIGWFGSIIGSIFLLKKKRYILLDYDFRVNRDMYNHSYISLYKACAEIKVFSFYYIVRLFRPNLYIILTSYVFYMKEHQNKGFDILIVLTISAQVYKPVINTPSARISSAFYQRYIIYF